MRVLVTGGAGFIGSHLVDRLAWVEGSKNEIVVLDNLSRGKLNNLAQSLEFIQFVEGDIRDKNLVAKLTAGVGVLYHLAAQSNVMAAEQDIGSTLSTNVWGTLNLLRAAHAARVPRVVFTSSREVYGDASSLPVPETACFKPKNAYGASKAAAEVYCRLYQAKGLDVSILRLANVYGPRDFGRVVPIFLKRAFANEPLMVYGGTQVLDLVWVEIVIQCLLRAGQGPAMDAPVNVGSGVGTTILQLAERVLAVTESASSTQILPPRSAEVCQFVSDTRKMSRLVDVGADGDPLMHLKSLARDAPLMPLPADSPLRTSFD